MAGGEGLCPEFTSLEEAAKPVKSSLFPVSGLRRTVAGELTADAIRTILDGLTSRGIDLSGARLLLDLETLRCRMQKRFAYLYTHSPELPTIEKAYLDLKDTLQVSRLLDPESQLNSGKEQQMVHGRSIEAFQVAAAAAAAAGGSQTAPTPLRMEMLVVSEQQAAEASNYIAFYGFMNILAVGLLFYIARAQ